MDLSQCSHRGEDTWVSGVWLQQRSKDDKIFVSRVLECSVSEQRGSTWFTVHAIPRCNRYHRYTTYQWAEDLDVDVFAVCSDLNLEDEVGSSHHLR